MLGDISSKYESGSLGPRAISSTPGDPGGASYGKFQLSSNTGTLQAFLNESGYDQGFRGVTPGTKKFNDLWLHYTDSSEDFGIAQWQYIFKTKFAPCKRHATELKIPSSAAVDELLWSISVQHGRYALLLQRAAQRKPETPEDSIKDIMDERVKYVTSLKSLSPEIKKGLYARYDSELKDLLGML